MSSGGQRPELAGHGDDAAAVFVATFPMPAGTRFDWHTHEDHQLAWAASGVLTVQTSAATWVLPPTRALWIPAGLPHETTRVAQALRDAPSDRRTLAEWGRQVAASGRTLARAFVAETGVPFGRWRTLLRLQAALPMLARGEPVSRVAGRVGYDTTSAFVAAFRRETGQTPGSFFRG